MGKHKRQSRKNSGTNSTQSKTANYKIWAGISSGILLLAVSVYGLMQSPAANAEVITVYKSPTCGCCKKWVSHLEDHGFTVKSHNQNDMSAIKKKLGVAPNLQSCHTAKVGGYVIEGHVPASDIQQLLAEKPDIHGLTVPGMPMGSPGMEGHRKDAYDVLSIDKRGRTSVFNQY